MSGTVQIPFLLVAVALGYALGWYIEYKRNFKTFDERQKGWRDILNHAEFEKHNLELKKDKLEKHMVESNKLLQEKDQLMLQLKEEAKAHGQQYKDTVSAYRETFEEKEGVLTQQMDTLKAKFTHQDSDNLVDRQQNSEELQQLQASMDKTQAEQQELVSARQELIQENDALQAQLAGGKRENQEMLLEAENHKNKSIELQNSIDALKQSHLQDLKSSQDELATSKQEYQASKDQYTTLVASTADLPDGEVLQSELASLQKHEDGLKDKIAELQEKVRHLEHESRDQITREKERGSMLREELETVKSEKNQLASQLLRAENHQQKETPESTTNIELLKEYQQLKTQFDEVTKSYEEQKRHGMLLEKDASESSQQLKEKEIQLIQFQAKVTQQEHDGQQELEQKLSSKSEEFDILEKELASKSAGFETLEKEVASKAEKFKLLEKELAEVQLSNNDQLKSELIESKQMLEKAGMNLEIAQNQANKTQKDRDNYRHKHLSVVNELERVKVSGAVSQTKILDLNKKLNPKREQELVRKHAAADKENKQLQRDMKNLSKLENENKVIKANLKIAENRYKIELGTLRGESKVAGKDIKAKEREVLKLQQQLDNLKLRVAAKNDAVKKAAAKKKVVKKKVVKKKVVKKKVAKKVVAKKVVSKAKPKPAKKVTPKKVAKKAVAPVVRKDDLQMINGIGPKLERSLNKMGIKSFAQIAALTKAEVEQVNDSLSFKGRVEREKWIPQAKKLTRLKVTTTSKPKTSKAAPVKKKAKAQKKVAKPSARRVSRKKTNATAVKDDLKQIKGIGPKLEKTLNKMDIKRFDDIASLQKTRIAEINAQLSFSGRIEREKWVQQARKLAKG